MPHLGHRFVLKTRSKSVLADLTPRVGSRGSPHRRSRRLGRRAEAVGEREKKAPHERTRTGQAARSGWGARNKRAGQINTARAELFRGPAALDFRAP
jgi:hypothetical protein